MKIRVITLFPDMIAAALGHGVCGRAIARGLADVESINPRDFAGDPHPAADNVSTALQRLAGWRRLLSRYAFVRGPLNKVQHPTTSKHAHTAQPAIYPSVQ